MAGIDFLEGESALCTRQFPGRAICGVCCARSPSCAFTNLLLRKLFTIC